MPTLVCTALAVRSPAFVKLTQIASAIPGAYASRAGTSTHMRK
jgi:hypothetical protein